MDIDRMADDSPQPIDSTPISNRALLIGALILVVFIAIIIVLVILAIRYPLHTETFRDLAVIALAMESGLIGLAILILIVQVARLTNMIDYEIKPILRNTSETINTVRGTANFMSERVVSPAIKVSGYARGASKLVQIVSRLFSTYRS